MDTTGFGTLLRHHRLRVGLTQDELAERAQMSVRGIIYLEQGARRPFRDTVRRLAEALALDENERAAFAAAAHRDDPGGPGAASVIDFRPAPLPVPAHELVGRAADVEAVERLLDPGRGTARLVTLTGPGGVGKTRLAVQVAADLRARFADGAAFVDLAPVADHALVASTAARTLGIRDTGGRPLAEVLPAALAGRRLLLVLDNCEHALPAMPLVAALVAHCPHLRVLATSRAPLQLRAEQQYPVPPLALPARDLRSVLSVAQVAAAPAVALFVQRAQAVQPDFALTEETVAAVAEICARLDGLPLAIELAAARVRALPLPALLAGLEHRLTLLADGNRAAPHRQRTMRATIAWSYSLLDQAERTLFVRLVVFHGGCTLEAIAAIMAVGHLGDPQDPLAVLAGVEALVAQSLLQAEGGIDEEPRFAMLETIRAYALERLAASGEAEDLYRAHAAYYLALAEEVAPALTGPAQDAWLERLEREHDNLRAVLRWALQDGEDDVDAARHVLGLRLASVLGRFWEVRGHLREGHTWLERLLAVVPPTTATEPRAQALLASGLLAHSLDLPLARERITQSLNLYRALGDRQGIATAELHLGSTMHAQGDYARATAIFADCLTEQRALGDRGGIAATYRYLGLIAHAQGDYAQAAGWYEQCLPLLRQVGDRRLIAFTLHDLGMAASYRGDYAAARARFDESRALFESLGDRHGLAFALDNLGVVLYEQGDRAGAQVLYEQSLALRREVGDRQGLALSLDNQATMAHAQGDDARARALYAESLAMFREREDAWASSYVLYHMGNLAQDHHDYERARMLYAESLELGRDVGAKLRIAEGLEGIASTLQMPEGLRCAARLFSAAAALRTAMGTPLPPSGRPRYDRALALARGAIGPSAFTTEWAVGQGMALEQAVAIAMAAALDEERGDQHRA